MKTILIMFGLLSLGACKHELYDTENYMDISVIRDVTDPHVLTPEANSILGLYNLSQNKEAGVNFRYREISDKVLVPVVDLHLPDESVTNKQNTRNEPMFREKTILNFYNDIRNTLSVNDTNGDSTFLDHSECFKTIASELSFLAESNSINRVLLIFSNLFENSEILTVYGNKNNKPFIQNPDKILSQFEQTHLLPENLKGIKIYFVFQPTTREKDFQYLKIVEVYRRLLEPRGATIKVQAVNNYLN